MVLIDTPGLNDTEESQFESDSIISRQLYELCTNTIDEVHAICIVLQFAFFRKGSAMKDFIDSIKKLFGTEMDHSIHVIITFDDGGTPLVLTSLREQNINIDSHFRFSNGMIFKDTEKIETWTSNQTNFKRFLDTIMKEDAKSINLSKTILKDRVRLRSLISDFQIKLKCVVQDIINIKIEKELKNKSDHEHDEQNSYHVTQAFITTARTRIFSTALNCTECERTCHYPCWAKWRKIKWTCEIMSDKACTVCIEGVCKMSNHVNESKRYVVIFKDQKRDIKDIKGEPEIEDTLYHLNIHLDKLVFKLNEAIRDLNTAYKKTNTIKQCLDQIIKGETDEEKCGFEKRIKFYEEIKKNL